jgi:glutamate-1-semialdehyde 2,1-aminomutase
VNTDVARADAVIPGATLGSFRLPPELSFVVSHGERATIWSTDGRRYVDYVLGSGPLVLGHAHPRIVAAVQEQMARGSTYYYLNEAATELAERVVELVPCAEAVKFCGSGSEATFYAMRIARAATGRELILKFGGGFHGAQDYSQQNLGPAGVQPESLGIPKSIGESVLVSPFNDLESVGRLAEANEGRIAAVVVEPVQRAIMPLPGFLHGLRDICTRIGALLIFDEIVTGFRMRLGGAQEEFRVQPDLCTLGKVLGGGLPLAAVAGPRELLELTVSGGAGRGLSAYMGNTLNGNPLSCVAGLATLDVLAEEDGCKSIGVTGDLLRRGLTEVASRLSVPLHMIGPPAFSEPVIGDGHVVDYVTYMSQDREASVEFGKELLKRGIFVNPGTKMYISTAHTSSDIDLTVEVAFDALRAVRDRGLVEV